MPGIFSARIRKGRSWKYPKKPDGKKPAIFAVDDDPDVLRAVTRDLKRHYGSEYKGF